MTTAIAVSSFCHEKFNKTEKRHYKRNSKFLGIMKKIEAIIRKTKFEEVKETLLDVGIEWFSYCEVRGIGKSRQDRIYRGVMYGTDIIERLMLTIVVRNVNVEKTVQAILLSAQTGEVGDGRIFVSPIDDSYRIRTGERGDISLYNPTDEELIDLATKDAKSEEVKKEDKVKVKL